MMRCLIVSVALLALAGCTGSTGSVTSSQIPMRSIASLLPPTQVVKPDTCDKPKVVLIKKVGGTFKIPTCSGWSGTFGYPPQAPVHWSGFRFQLTSSVNNNFGAPPPPSGTAIFYLQMEAERSNNYPYFKDTGVTNMILSSQLNPSSSYSLYVYGFGGGLWSGIIGSPSPSADSITFVSPLNGNWFTQSIVWQFVVD